jgi:hypothetical protein
MIWCLGKCRSRSEIIASYAGGYVLQALHTPLRNVVVICCALGGCSGVLADRYQLFQSMYL